MDASEYKEEFVSESREHLDVLNEGLLVLEKDSSNMDNINKLFRAFHTLKGNAATMGFVKFSELAHSLEDVLSRIRDGELKINKNVMDLVFQGVDTLEKGLEYIADDNAEGIDAEGLIKDLKDSIGVTEQKFEVSIPADVLLSPEEKAKIEALKAKGESPYRIIIVFEATNVLKTAKALVLLRDLSEDTTLVKTTPVDNDIRKGRFNTEIEIVLGSKKDKIGIEKEVNNISGLKHVFVMGIDEKYEKPKDTAIEEKEHAKAEIAKAHQNEVVKQIQSVKVDMKRLDKLMNLVGELLISNIRLQDINKKEDYSSLRTVLAGVDRLILDLQDEVMRTRMVPIGNIFNRFPRMIRDLAEKEGKKIELVIEGQDIEFDRTVLDQIGDPLVHLLRNSVDHGIEKPEERLNAGKNETGTIKLIARREKNNAVIEVSDDGAGIDPKAVKAAVIRKGEMTEEEASKLSDRDLQMLVFKPGHSTNTVVTEVSGRGVGMDVVLSKTTELGGSVKLNSIVGQGTTTMLQLPLTVAIITALIVKADGEYYAVPLASVEQTVDVTRNQIKTIQGHELFVLRGHEVPIFWMSGLMGKSHAEDKQKMTVVIVNKDGENVGIVVDSIVAQQQVLLKGLQDLVKGTRGVAGATILGDGSVVLILDIATLL